jgi:hypothetical protein
MKIFMLPFQMNVEVEQFSDMSKIWHLEVDHCKPHYFFRQTYFVEFYRHSG